MGGWVEVGGAERGGDPRVAGADHGQVHGRAPLRLPQRDRAGPGGRRAGGAVPSCAAWPGSRAVLSWGTMMPAASAGVMAGYSALMTAMASAAPRLWAPMKARAEAGAIPAKVAEKMRPMVMAGMAKVVADGNH